MKYVIIIENQYFEVNHLYQVIAIQLEYKANYILSMKYSSLVQTAYTMQIMYNKLKQRFLSSLIISIGSNMIKTIEHHIQNIASEQNSNVNSSEIFNHTVILLAEIRENIDYLILEQDDSLTSCLENLQKLIGYIHINNTQKIQIIKEYNSLIEDIFESYDHIQIKKENLLIREQNSKTTTRIQTESISDFLDKGQNEKLKENLYNQIKENYDSLMIKEIINYNSSRQKQIDYKKQDVSSQNTSIQTNSLNKKLIYLWIIVSFVILAEVTFVCIFVYQNKEFLSDFPILNFFSDEPNTLELWKDE